MSKLATFVVALGALVRLSLPLRLLSLLAWPLLARLVLGASAAGRIIDVGKGRSLWSGLCRFGGRRAMNSK
jgi:hypothetical protein